MTDSSEATWQGSLVPLAEARRNLEVQVRELSDDRLGEIVLGDRLHFIYTLLHGVIQHNLYHAGRIALLKKLMPGRPLSDPVALRKMLHLHRLVPEAMPARRVP